MKIKCTNGVSVLLKAHEDGLGGESMSQGGGVVCGASVRQEKFVSNEARGWEYVSNKGVCVKPVTHTSIAVNVFICLSFKEVFVW